MHNLVLESCQLFHSIFSFSGIFAPWRFIPSSKHLKFASATVSKLLFSLDFELPPKFALEV